MSLDDEIRRQELQHKQATRTMLEVELHLTRLYSEKSITEQLCEQLKTERVDVQIVDAGTKSEVHLTKGELRVSCTAGSLASALLGAHTALRGEMVSAL